MASLLEDMRGGRTVLCVGVRSFIGASAVRVLQDVGVGALYLDIAHDTGPVSAALPMLAAARQAGMHVLARSADALAGSVAMAAVAAPEGVIVPDLRTADQVRAIATTLQAAARDGGKPVFIGMVESSEGVARIDELLGVGALDMVFLGMSDLTADLGVHREYGHPSVEAAFGACLQACRRANCLLGIGGMGAYPSSLAAFARRGANFLSLGSDEDVLRRGLAGRREELLGLLAG